MNLACSREELNRLLAEVAFTRNLGLRLDSIEEGACSIEVPFSGIFSGLQDAKAFIAGPTF